jgi:hypothetical protein
MSGRRRLGAPSILLTLVALAIGASSAPMSVAPVAARSTPASAAAAAPPPPTLARLDAARDHSPVGLSTATGSGASRLVRLDLYRPGDFVTQTTLVQCVGASMQMMLNMIRRTDDRTAATQLRLFNLAKSLRDPVLSNPSWQGASATGWAAGLTGAGAGSYAVESTATLEEALTLAAAAIARTGRPVGLLVWQGAHAWVMSGFEATGDPAADPSARVTGVQVLDPLYPRSVGSPWGPGPAPNATLSVAQLGRVFVPYRPHGRSVELRNRYVLVLPFQPLILSRLQVRPI